MKKLSMILMAALLVLAFSCKKEKNEDKPVGQGFNAYLETQSGDSKTYLGPDGHKVCWETTDAILVSNGSASAEFSLTTIDPNNGCAHFDASVQEGFYTGNYTAYYPKDLLRNGLVYLDHEQTYVELNGASSFAKGANPMVAYSSTNELHFSNICGMLALPLKGTCTVKSIQLSAKGTQNLWGTGQLNGTDLGTLSNGGTSITLDCGTGITLDANTPKTFYFVLPPVTLAQGVDVLLTDSENKVWKKSASTSVAIHKNSIRKMQDATVVVTTPVTPAVTLTGACNSSTFIYTVTGKVTIPSGSGSQHCVYGIVYSTTDDTPTIGEEGVTNLQLFDGNFSGSKTFTVDIPSAVEGETYHVCAYAMCEGMAYSPKVDVTKPAPNTWTNGQSPYPFSVSSTKKVYFSKGNLQYLAEGGDNGNANPSAISGQSVGGTWRFAEHQYEYMGNNNNGANHQSTCWIDLFGWATSGYNHNGNCYQPWSQDTDYGKFCAYGTSLVKDLSEDPYYADWGYNKIINGGNATNQWRTLTGNQNAPNPGNTDSEWGYLIFGRSNASDLKGFSTVCCHNGLVILPDDWKNVNKIPLPYTWMKTLKSTYTPSEWSLMEQYGAVFLPMPGAILQGSGNVQLPEVVGFYWASTYYRGSGSGVSSFDLQGTMILQANQLANNRFPVRLVKNAN